MINDAASKVYVNLEFKHNNIIHDLRVSFNNNFGIYANMTIFNNQTKKYIDYMKMDTGFKKQMTIKLNEAINGHL